MKILAIVDSNKNNIERRLKALHKTVTAVLCTFATILGIYGYFVWRTYDLVMQHQAECRAHSSEREQKQAATDSLKAVDQRRQQQERRNERP